MTGIRGGRRGFALAPILYMLGLIGVGAGVLFSGYSQILRSNQQVTNNLSTKNDLDSIAVTLAATSTLSSDTTLLCPPTMDYNESANCSSPLNTNPPPTKATALAGQAQLPAHATNAGNSGLPDEVGIFIAGAGFKQLDAWGHFYIYCRWENPVSMPSKPAIRIISAGPDGVLDTACGDAAAKNDDIVYDMSVGTAINRSAVWQAKLDSNGNTTDLSFGQPNHQLNVDATGDLTVPGTLGVSGVSTLNAATVTTNETVGGNLTVHGSYTGTSATFSGAGVFNTLVVGASSQMSVDAAGNISTSGLLNAGTAAISGSLSAGAATISSTLNVAGNTTLGGTLGVASDATLNGALNVTSGATALGGTLGVTGATVIGNSAPTAGLTIGSAVVSAGSSKLLSVGKVTGGVPLFSVDTYGNVVASAASAGSFSGGSFSGGSASFGSTSAGALNAGATALSDALTGTSATFSGMVTAQGFTGKFNVGGSGGGAGSISGVIPIANGGTGGTTASAALDNLFGGDTGGSATIAAARFGAGTIQGADLVSGTVTSTQLNATGVAPGAYNNVVVGSDGRVISASSVAYAPPNQIYDSNNDAVSVGTAAGGQITFSIGGVVKDEINSQGYLGLGTTTPHQQLEVDGNEVITGNAGTNRQLLLATTTAGAPVNRWAVEAASGPESGGNSGSDFVLQNYSDSGVAISTANPALTIARATGNATFEGGVTAPGFYGNLTGNVTGNVMGNVYIGTSSAATNPQVNGHAGTGLYSPDGANSLALATGGAGQLFVDASGHVSIGKSTANAGAILDLSASTGTLILPVGNTTQEPASAVPGMIRFNTTTQSFEGFDGTYWDDLGGEQDTFVAGSVTTPGISVETDTGTGLFQATSGTLSVATEGTEAARFLQGPANAKNYLTFKGSANGSAPILGVAGPSDANIALQLAPLGSAGVGIGTNAPASKLQVYGGEIQTGTSGGPCNALNAGAIRYTAGMVSYCDGNTYTPIASGSGSLATSVTLGTSLAFNNPSRNGELTTGLYTPASGAVGVSSLGVEVLRVNGTGLGIGVAAGYPFDLEKTSTATGGNAVMSYNALTVAPASSSSAISYAGENSATVTTAYAGTSTVVGGYNQVTTAVGGTAIGTSFGSYNATFNTGSGTITGANGSLNKAENTATGVLTTAYGAFNLAKNDASGTITAADGTLSRVHNAGSGTITTATSLQADLVNSGSVGTWYGLYVPAVTGTAPTNRFPLRIEDTGASYFAGSIGLGTAAPATTLAVNGTAGLLLGTDYTTTGTQNNVSLGAASSIRYTGSAAATFTGIAAGGNGQLLYLHNASGSTLTVSNQNAASAAANRVITGTGTDLQMLANSSAALQYDTSASVWRVVGGTGGGTTGSYLGVSLSSTNPSRSYTELNTGLFSPASGQVSVASLGTELMRVGTAGVAIGSGYVTAGAPTNGMIVQGNVGIGTTAANTSALLTIGNTGLVTVDNSGNITAQSLNMTGTGNCCGLAVGDINISMAYSHSSIGGPGFRLGDTNGGTHDYIASALSFGSSGTPKSTIDIVGNLAVGSYADSVAAPTNGLIVSGNVGIGTTTPGSLLTVNGTEGLLLGADYTTTGAQNNVALGAASSIRYSGAGAATFTGIAAGQNGQLLYLHNAATGTLTISNQNAGSSAANRVITGSGGDLALPANSSVAMQYDTVAARWRVVGSSNSNTTLSFAAGTAANPGLGVQTDLATGLFQATTGSLSIASEGVEAARFANGGGLSLGTSYAATAPPANGAIIQGNVGIGTTAPQMALQVYGGQIQTGTTGANDCSALTAGAIRYVGATLYYCDGTAYQTLYGTGSSVNAGINLGASASATNPSRSGQVGTGFYSAGSNLADVAIGSSKLVEWSANGENLVTGGLAIGSSYSAAAAPANGMIVQGSVGIGTVTPYGTFDVRSGTNANLSVFSNSDLGTGTTVLSTVNDSNSAVMPLEFSASKYNFAAGNVGIGTTGPLNKLDVSGGTAIGAGYAGVTAAPANGAIIQGNVGIGATAPQSALGVNGGVAIGTTYAGTNAAGANNLIVQGSAAIGTPAAGQALTVVNSTAGLTFPIQVANLANDNVNTGAGIIFTAGTGSINRGKGALAYVYGTQNSWNRGDFYFLQNGAADTSLATLSNVAMSITNAGRVGIGTATPNAGAILDLSQATSSLILPRGNTAQEPAAAVTGMVRFNITTASFEGFDGTYWDDLGGSQDTFVAGTVGMPGLSVETDQTTGLYQATTGTLSVTAEGKEAGRFLSGAGTVANYLTFTGAAAGNGPILGAGGSDTNIALSLTPKGAGNVVVTANNLIVATGAAAIGTNTPRAGTALDLGSNTNSLLLPGGTTAQEPTGIAGMLRFNASTPALEAYYNGQWNSLLSNNGSVAAGSITGTVAVANGGTGDNSLATHGLLIGEGTAAVAVSGTGTAGQALLSGGASADPAYGLLSLTNAVTGTLAAAQFPALTGDITTAAGSLTATIGTNKVTTTDLAQIAGVSVLANAGSATGNVATLTGAANQLLQVNSAGTALAFAALNLAGGAVTGSLGVANGGTGVSSLTQYGVVLGNGTAAVTTATGAAGTLFAGNGSANPAFSATPYLSGSLAIGTASATNTLAINGTEGLQLGADYTTTGAQNNVALGAASSIRYSGAGAATFTGIAAGQNGQLLYLHNAATGTLTLSNQSTSSAAANRIVTGSGGDLAMIPNSSVQLQYDTTASLWRIVGGTGIGSAGLSSGIYLGTSAGITNPARSTGELNTGLFSPASGQVAVSALGTQILTVTGTGIGIGTAVPYGTLDVRSGTNANLAIFSNIDLGSGTTVVSTVNDTDSAVTPLEFSASKYNFAAGNVGIGTTTAGSLLTVNGTEGLLLGADYTTTGTQNNVALGAASSIRYSGAGAATFTGIGSGQNGQLLYLHNASTGTLTLSNQNTGSAAANRIVTGNGSDLQMAANSSIALQYDTAAALWRVIGGTGGGSTGTYLGLSAGAANPARNNTELNTGLFSATTGTVSVTSLGTETARFGNSGGLSIGTGYAATVPPSNGAIIQGKVAIGLTAPSSVLTVGGNPPVPGVIGAVTAAGSISLALSDNTYNSLYVRHLPGAATFTTDGGGQIAFATNGSSTPLILLSNSGNVGIGTSTPTNLLSLNGQNAQTFWLERDATAATAGQQLTVQSGGAYTGGTNLNGGALNLAAGISTGTGSSAIQFTTYPATVSGTADNTALAAASLMATGTLAANNVNTVIQGAAGSGTNANGGNLALSGGASTGIGSSSLYFNVYNSGASGASVNGPTTAMTIIGSGNVGIGTNAPNAGAALDLGSNTTALLLPKGTTGQEPAGVAGMLRYNTTTAALETYSGSAWSSLITGSGGLGSGVTLGTSASLTNPQKTGDAATGLFSSAAGTVSVASAGAEVARFTGTGLSVGTAYAATAAPANGAIIQGNLGIGTNNPSQALTVAGGGIKLDNAQSLFWRNAGGTVDSAILTLSGSTTIMHGGGGAPTLQMQTTSGTPIMSLLESGNVGIGTTGPNYNLDVGGGSFGAGGGATGFNVSSSGYAAIGLPSNSYDRLFIQENANRHINLSSISNTVSPIIFTQKYRAGSAAVQNGDTLFTLDIRGWDGASPRSAGAINAIVDGTVSTNYVPTSLTFSTEAASGTAYAVERMRINSAGNVGIGTNAPYNLLDVYTANPTIAARASYTGGSATVEAQASDYYTTPSYTTTAVQQFSSAATGTTAALPNALLGYLNFQNTANALIGTNGGAPLEFATAGTERMRITGSGNVGIGTTAPANRLDVAGGQAVGAGYAGLYTAPANGMIIQGNVGIGLNNPSNNLDVNGSTRLNGQLLHQNGYAYIGVYNSGGVYPGFNLGGLTVGQNFSSGNAELNVWNTLSPATYPATGIRFMQQLSASSYRDLMFMSNTGNVGIGTTAPANRLDVAGGQAVGAGYAGLYTAPANGMIIQGNVGIGLNNPSNNLDVNGSTRLNGQLLHQNGYAYIGVYNSGGVYPGFNLGGLTVGQNFSSGNAELNVWNTLSPATYPATGIRFMQQLSASSYRDLMFMSNTGNVGIGTTAPANRLDVAGGQAVGAGYAGLYTAPANGMIIQGNVGIGLNNPSNNLDVNGSTRLNGQLLHQNGYAYIGVYNSGGVYPGFNLGGLTVGQNFSSGNAELNVWNTLSPATYPATGIRFMQQLSASSYRDLMFMSNTGNVGIGTTSPNGKLAIGNNVSSGGPAGAYGSYQEILFDGGTANASYGLGIEASNMWFNSNSGYKFYVAGTVQATINASGTYTAVSDRRLKTDIKPLAEVDGLAAVMRLQPVTYRWKDATKAATGEHTGFIAQEVEQVLPQLVTKVADTSEITLADGSKEIIKDTKGVDYAGVVVPLVKAVQELKGQNDRLQAEIDGLKASGTVPANDNIGPHAAPASSVAVDHGLVITLTSRDLIVFATGGAAVALGFALLSRRQRRRRDGK